METFTVSSLTQALKQCIEGIFGHVQVKGEVSSLKYHTSGHLYFSIKDTTSTLPAVLFKRRSSHEPLKEGDMVILSGYLTIYPPSGRYQLVVENVEKQGLGELLLKLEALKKELLQKGYFSEKRKKPIPFLPKRIGVITSPAGAVIHDILTILSRRYPNFQLLLYPIKVQGAGAKEEIVEAIRYFNEHPMVDVLILCRGGGSLEDLWAFNEREVADALFTNRIPTICAVGHETDHSIAEYVADRRAPTPSAAAEMVLPEKHMLLHSLADLQRKLSLSLKRHIDGEKAHLYGLSAHPLIHTPQRLFVPFLQKIDLLSQEIPAALLRLFEKKREQLYSWEQMIRAIHPKQLLQRGYAILSSSQGRPITSIVQMKVDDCFHAELFDGMVYARISEVKHHER